MNRIMYIRGIQRVLSTYQFGSRSLIVALEALINTAMDNAEAAKKDELAELSCQGLHSGPPAGIICKRCFDAVETGQIPEETDLELAPETPSEKKERSAIEDSVKHMLSMKDE